jgi:GrpB-like predicted nucleotidyltransferase (UPF0157 family)
MSDRIVLAPYDPAWPEQFEAERALLEQVLRPWLEGGIHHIGSTAIPNMRAKRVIDMMAGGARPRRSARRRRAAR